MFDRTYQPGVADAPWVMADNECARDLVFRQGFGWVERPVEPEVVVEQGAESAA